MVKKITSLQNPEIKRLLQLQEKPRIRRKEGLFVIEGQRESRLAEKGGINLVQLYFCASLMTLEDVKHLFPAPEIRLTEISEEIYAKIAYRGSTEGILAVGQIPELSLNKVVLSRKQPLILVAEAPEKPGNIGALLRTADAASVDAVLLANPRTDLFNPNIIRSSVGCLFTNQVASGSTAEILAFLRDKKLAVYGAALQASVPYDTVDLSKGCAIVVGTEAVGLSSQWIENTTKNIIIPMEGEIDSMNVSVAAGILLFEAKRQRKATQEL